MAGLLVKDMRLILRNKPYVVLFIVLTVMLGFSQEGTFILGYFPYAMMILNINTIGYDEMDNGYQFLMTLPINAKTYVREKYILSLAGAVFSWLIAAILYFASRALHGTSIEIQSEVPLIAAFLPVIVLMGDLMIPLELKFGIENSRAVVAGLCGVLGVVIFTFAKFTGDNGIVPAFSYSMSGGMFACLAVCLTVFLTVLSYVISVRVMEKKEF